MGSRVQTEMLAVLVPATFRMPATSVASRVLVDFDRSLTALRKNFGIVGFNFHASVELKSSQNIRGCIKV